MVPLVTMFEKLSPVTTPFWSRDKEKRGICLFHEQNLRRADVVVHSLAASTRGLPLYIPDLRRVSSIHPFLCMDFSVCSFERL